MSARLSQLCSLHGKLASMKVTRCGCRGFSPATCRIVARAAVRPQAVVAFAYPTSSNPGTFRSLHRHQQLRTLNRLQAAQLTSPAASDQTSEPGMCQRFVVLRSGFRPPPTVLISSRWVKHFSLEFKHLSLQAPVPPSWSQCPAHVRICLCNSFVGQHPPLHV